jgi:hypothetical protein
LEKIGFTYKGEWNIPFKFGFTKRTENSINLHVLKEGHPEIGGNLLFRKHLRSNPQSLPICKAERRVTARVLVFSKTRRPSVCRGYFG